jgi:hypothetical protein
MKYVTTVEIPQLMREHCSITEKGLPVPYIVLEKEGVHYFKINDDKKIFECLMHRKCTVCGTKLENDIWFIGGPASAFHKHGAFNDAPVHKECGLYSLKICPYLAFSRYSAKINLEKLQSKFDDILLVNNTQDPDRVPLFAFVKAKNYKINFLSQNLIPEKPYLEVEYWNDGKQLSQKEGEKIVKEHFKEKYNINM